MYLSIYSPGAESLSGDFRAQFDINSGAVPPAITTDINIQIGGNPIVLHPTSFDSVSKRYILPFTTSGNLDLTSLVFGLYLTLGITTDAMKIVSIDYSLDMPDWIWIVGLIIIIYFLRKV